MRRATVFLLIIQMAVVAASSAQPAKPLLLDRHGDPLPSGALARLGTLRFQPSDNSIIDDIAIGRRGYYYVNPPCIALSPDGSEVAIATRGKDGMQLALMDPSTGKIRRKRELKDIDGDQMQFTSRGDGLVFSGWSNVKFVDCATGKTTQSIFLKENSRDKLALSPDGKWIAFQKQKVAYDAPVALWDAATGKEAVLLPGRGASCQGLAFGPDSKRLLLWSVVPSAVNDKTVTFSGNSKAALACIDIAERKIVGEIDVGNAQFIALCPDGETVAFEAPDHMAIHVRHLPTGAERCVIPAAQAKFAFAPDGKTLLTIDGDRRAALWNAAKGDKTRDLEGALVNQDFRIAGISKDGATIAVVDGGWRSAAAVVVWNAITGKRSTRPPGHEGAITCLAYAPGGKLLASGSLDHTVRLWDSLTGEHLRELIDHGDAITAVAFSPDGKMVASSSRDGAVRVCRAADGVAVKAFAGPDKGASALAFSSDGKTIFAGGRSPAVLAWNLSAAKEVVRLDSVEEGAVMAFAEGGALAVIANGESRRFREESNERLHVLNPLSKLPVATIPISTDRNDGIYCHSAVFSPGNRFLASSQISVYEGIRPSYGAALLRLWEVATGQPIQTLSPAVTKVLTFSPSGRLLASGGAGKPGHLNVGHGAGIDIWDIVTGVKADTLPVTPECLAFSPDGKHVATGGRDPSILIWKAPSIPRPGPAKAPTAAVRDTWWTALGGDANHAYKAIGQMIAAPDAAVSFLKERVQPVRPSDSTLVAKLIEQLDSTIFSERDQAQAALEKMGEGAAHLLAKALEGDAALELRRRLESLLRKCDATSVRGLQHHRAVATLEWIDAPAARDLLRALAEGAPAARLTVEALAASKRLAR